MARANGGEILIKIPKDIGDITASDFDISLFEKITSELILKSIKLITNDMIVNFTSINITNNACYCSMADSTYDVLLAYHDNEMEFSYTEI